MPTAVFSDNDLIETIARTTGYRPNIIRKKEINEKDQLIVIWK